MRIIDKCKDCKYYTEDNATYHNSTAYLCCGKEFDFVSACPFIERDKRIAVLEKALDIVIDLSGGLLVKDEILERAEAELNG